MIFNRTKSNQKLEILHLLATIKSNNHNNMNHLISKREEEVLHLVAYEQSTKEIALTLFISEHTVISHRKNLLNKMNAKNTAGLVRRAFELGILQITNAA